MTRLNASPFQEGLEQGYRICSVQMAAEARTAESFVQT